MEFQWTEKHKFCRARIADFLANTLPDDWDQIALHGPGSDAQTDYSRTFCKLLDDVYKDLGFEYFVFVPNDTTLPGYAEAGLSGRARVGYRRMLGATTSFDVNP